MCVLWNIDNHRGLSCFRSVDNRAFDVFTVPTIVITRIDDIRSLLTTDHCKSHSAHCAHEKFIDFHNLKY